jgi:Family of unknown function (DUF695)
VPLFRRRRTPPPPAADAVPGFWRWWTTEGARHCAHLLDSGNTRAIEPVLGPAVSRVHPDLAYEIGPVDDGGWLLVVTAAGDPPLRATARRWLRAAPPPDGQWRYADTRQPSPVAETAVLTITGREIPFADLCTGWQVDDDRLRVDVAVHHPAFAALDEDTRLEIGFLALDALLGEEAVELWVGEVSAVVDEPPGATSLAALRSAVRDLAARHSGPEPTWQLMRATASDGRPVTALVRLPLTSAAAPALDAHVRVEVPFAAEESGLPRPEALDRLRALEDRLTDLLGDDGRVVAHLTSGGLRTVHVYADSATDAAERVVATIEAHPGARATVTADPAWEAVAHLRG